MKSISRFEWLAVILTITIIAVIVPVLTLWAGPLLAPDSVAFPDAFLPSSAIASTLVAAAIYISIRQQQYDMRQQNDLATRQLATEQFFYLLKQWEGARGDVEWQADKNPQNTGVEALEKLLEILAENQDNTSGNVLRDTSLPDNDKLERLQECWRNTMNAWVQQCVGYEQCMTLLSVLLRYMDRATSSGTYEISKTIYADTLRAHLSEDEKNLLLFHVFAHEPEIAVVLIRHSMIPDTPLKFKHQEWAMLVKHSGYDQMAALRN